MQVFHHVASLRQALNTVRSTGKTIGFVPTMGNLHDAHIELINIARQHCDLVVVSIFVNRLQFSLNEDWDIYPRTMQQDMARLREANCNYLFHPDENEIYPNGMDEQTRVICPAMSDVLCGASRPGHFEGVTTVVAKLFNIVQPHKAVFGIKDFQQLALIRRMVEDLCIPLEIIPAPVHREADGLAMSSRNGYLTPQERTKAAVLNQVLNWARTQIKQGRRDFAALEQEATTKIEQTGFKVDYFSICHSSNLQPAACDDSAITLLGAMYTSRARLIDNVSLKL
ncbi:MAG: pantoate--beta-alanine ligase [Gammaproteobacteria bacterium]|nr:pantoate--beta-alanine ligase [Gammaproteobacteria bacterium]